MVAIDQAMEVDLAENRPRQNARGLNPKFMDLFWKLAENDSSKRLVASLDIIKQLKSPNSTESQLSYTVGRLVQGLASTRESARHGYFVTLVGILQSFPSAHLPDKVFHDAVSNKLVIEGSKKEKVDLQIGQILAYGALLRSGRITDENVTLVANQFLKGSEIKKYIQPVAFGFLNDLLGDVDSKVFKRALWPLVKPKLLLSWDEHSFDTLDLLLSTRNRFPKVVKDSILKNVLGSSSVGDPECFSDLTSFILRNTSYCDHPIYKRIACCLVESGTLADFWEKHFDPALDSPSKVKVCTAFTLMKNIISEMTNSEDVAILLSKNIVLLLITSLQAKDDSLQPHAEAVLESLKSLMGKDDVTPVAQIAIVEKLLKEGHVAFDKNTDTRFISTVTPLFKKEAVFCLADIYRSFVAESNRTQDRIAVIQHLSKLLNHLAIQREVDWKASQLVFLARWGYFTPTASKVLTTIAKDTFHRALDSSCKKLEDLSSVLFKAFIQVNEWIPSSDISEEVKVMWNSVLKSAETIEKKQRSTKPADCWTGQVFLVLYLNMGFELLRDHVLPNEIIGELDTCYLRATDTKKKKNKAREEEDPHWLAVVTDILLSLLSRNQHLLRTIVVSVWSLVVEHLTVDTLQQVLDVIDPTKKETLLVDQTEEESSISGSDEEDEQTSEEEEAAVEEEEASEEEESETEDKVGDGDSDSMDEEETVTDKLRMRIHEALGDSAALTDTESVDIDDLSDGQMESLDRALSSAFQEFRKARPVRKNVNKLPKDQTALMHFRLRCLDLIELMTEKEVGIHLNTAALLPLLSLLEVTVKEPLQKPLMDRTRYVLRKLINVRKFAESNEVKVADLVKLLQLLLSKPYAKRALMPYISDDLVQCCTFVLRCSLQVTRTNRVKSASTVLTNGKGTQEEVDGVYQLYLSNLSKFFVKRDSPVPFAVFSRALMLPWPDASLLLEPLTDFAFGSTIIKNRKFQAIQLLASLFRNSTAMSFLGQPLLVKRVETLLQRSQQVLETTGNANTKPKYLNELFILLRVIFNCPELADCKGFSELWKPLKAAFALFLPTNLAKQKELKSNCLALARLLDVTTTLQSGGQNQQQIPNSHSLSECSNPIQLNGKSENLEAVVPTSAVLTKKRSNKHTGEKEKKEVKKRRMTAFADGLKADAVFSHVDVDMDEAPQAEPIHDEDVARFQQKNKKKVKVVTNKEPFDEKIQTKKSTDPAMTTENPGKKKKKRDKSTVNP